MEQQIRDLLIVEAMGVLVEGVMATIILAIIIIIIIIINPQEKVSHYITLFANNGTSGLVHLETDAIGGMCVGHAQKQVR